MTSLKSFWVGLLFGMIFGGLALAGAFIWYQRQQGTTINSFRPTNSPTAAAGTATNFAANIPPSQQVHLTVALADNSTVTGTNPTDLTSVAVTITRAEAVLTVPDLKLPTTILPHDETLNINQPTIELFSLRGSGSVATIGATGLAPGQYSGIRLTIGGAKGRDASGRIFDIRLPNNSVTMTINRPFVWTNAQDVQLVVDLDSFASLSQAQNDYVLTPVVRQILQNDEIVPAT